ncbi:Rrf2 family transcriptional regulator [Microvirga sp. 3-52]|uniref:Rrf2 family transcriptional regulator n=1 Tax=Microvirga sp. 3-52 TaxID=2792425 RepID=UPI001ACBDBA5|nr:Rrf2 family transcriptional regulator [Microvirga sp. 3-52]MBO1907906.1 Rrf2 family transcriptional regulator [Microvirga sp. 3-52]MBS7455107.1 Rrf2 family transcriptional regulator [Microvirga sp. 3-52]
MRQNGSLSRILHVLLHMEQHRDAMTSEQIGRMLGTNPTVVRRTMAGLREAGYVSSVKGHGGGWTLARPLADMTLLDVYTALGAPELFALGMATDAPECLVEQAVNAALGQTLEEAERQLLARFGEVRLSEIAADFTLRAAVTTRGTCQGKHIGKHVA